ncbi:InlB B-repeat-containing protein [Paenibacillus sp. Root52]|uniref:InlB B-repeat-containing protein n=1 Tax=Paenibacillus sp. Root52 TaxID=1736552 RepID=UPI0009E6B8CD|nr:InlB B-repeat-containing protein [Paenibacillus sp. Root52]
MLKKRVVPTVSMFVVIVSMAIIVIFNNQSLVSANMVTTPIYVSEDTTIVYEGVDAGMVYEDGNLGYLDVGYQGTYGNPLEVQVLLKFNLPPTPEGYEIETANLYIPVTGGTFQQTNFMLKVSTSTDHSWMQDSGITSPPAPTPASAQSRLLASTVPHLKPTLAPFTFTSYISAESTKANPRATFILSGMTVQEAAQAGIQYADHFIQMIENNAGGGISGPYLIMTYSELVNIEITGVTDIGIYNTSVIPQFNVGTATLNGSPFTSGTTVSAEGSYTLVVTSGGQQETVQFRIDKTSPTATVLINNGSLFTNNQNVSIRITPHPGMNDIVSMRFSVNGGSISTTQPYYSEFQISVGAANGPKSVNIELIDAAGNVSPLYFWNFSMNTTIPTGTLTINGGATFTTRQEVDLLITPDAGANEIVKMQFSTDNNRWSSEESYSPSKSFTLPAGDGIKTIYVRFIDRAGNVGSAQSSIILDTIAPVVSGVAEGGSYTSSRTITFNEGAATLNGGSFVSGTTVDTDGSYVLVVTDRAGNSTTITFNINKPAPIRYSVKYDGNGATGGQKPVDSQSYENGHTVTVSDNSGDLVRTGFAFNGWNTKADGSGINYAANNNFNINAADVILYALWTVNSYTLSFESNGGNVVATQNLFYNATAIEPTAPTRPGYTFGGWFKEAAIINQWNFKKDVVTANKTLYAKWIINNSSNNNGGGGGGNNPTTPSQNSIVFFETNGGNVLDYLSVAYDTKLAELPIPTRKGYTFDGWYHDVALTNKWDITKDRVTKNAKLYAKWVENTASIPTPDPQPTPDESESERPVVTFDDLSGHWAKEMIEELASQGIIAGYPDGSFHPNENIKRHHMALLFTRTFEFEPTREAVSFSDVSPSRPYYEAIMSLQQAGIVEGSNGEFNPNHSLTRAEMAKILTLALEIEPGGAVAFQDVPTTHWSYDYIATLAELEIVLGDNGKFKPDEPVTRAQFVAMMYRALKVIQ